MDTAEILTARQIQQSAWHHLTKGARRKKISAYMRKRYAKKRDELLAKSAEYHRLNGDKIRAQQREYRLRNLELKRQKCREWHAARKNDPAYKKQHSERGKASYQKNKAKIQAKHREWLKRNPGYMSAVKHRRRLIENASKNLAAIKSWMKSVKSKATAVCYYCQKTIPTKGLHFDHIVCIANGGVHDVSNLCVSCPRCNLTKQDKEISAWVRVGQQVLNL
jgi:5-methylcytosine-specific restriction endonuclease McrA